MTTAARPRPYAAAAVVAALAYAGLRLLWELRPPTARLSPIDTDLVGIDGWAAVGMCVAAALAAAALIRPTAFGLLRQVRLVVAGGVCLALVAVGGPLLLLDIVGGLFPGTGIGFYPLGAVSRVACLTVGLALGSAVATDVLSRRAPCVECGRRVSTWTSSLKVTPRWVYAAAYISVVGFSMRVLAQAVVGFDKSPLSSGLSLILFEVAVGLAGTALPLALVHRWGRRLPRWLVLGPAAFTSGGVVIYFSVLLGQMVAERLAGRNPFPPSGGLDLPEAFFWVAVPAYLVWGVGMAIAALFYFRSTRAWCDTCGQ